MLSPSASGLEDDVPLCPIEVYCKEMGIQYFGCKPSTRLGDRWEELSRNCERFYVAVFAPSLAKCPKEWAQVC